MKQIILMEDDPAICDGVTLVLKSSQCDVQCKPNEKELLDGSLDAPSLFMIDKNLSGSDGLEICRFIKQHPKYKHIPVVMISADPDIPMLAQEAGADSAIIKPFRIKTLREVIFNFLP